MFLKNIFKDIKIFDLGATGIEPMTSAHETDDLPLIYTPSSKCYFFLLIDINDKYTIFGE